MRVINIYKTNSGFTLIEMAIVMLIIGALIGSAILPLKAQRESNNIKQARAELKTIEQAIYGYAIANARLPCPAQPGSGLENLTADVCTNNSIGFVPSTTLGIGGNINCDNLIVDPWGNPYRYSVTESDSNAINGPDFTSPTDIVDIDVALLDPDLRVCINNTCAPASARLTNEAIAVIYSMGKNRNNTAGVDEEQNGGEGTIASGACIAGDYGVGADNDYVSHLQVEAGANQFDDIMLWISENLLYAKLLSAGQL
jgi:prepilin-type N-terminal cleavage/methylation domain-containing protein